MDPPLLGEDDMTAEGKLRGRREALQMDVDSAFVATAWPAPTLPLGQQPGHLERSQVRPGLALSTSLHFSMPGFLICKKRVITAPALPGLHWGADVPVLETLSAGAWKPCSVARTPWDQPGCPDCRAGRGVECGEWNPESQPAREGWAN